MAIGVGVGLAARRDLSLSMIQALDNLHDIRWLLEREPSIDLLYKFRSCRDARHQLALERGKIYIGEAMALNDPFDSKPKEFLHRETANEANAYRDLVRQLRILCFSGPFKGNGDDILRWSHYADGHRGYCIMLNHPALLPRVRQVSYEATYPNLAQQTPTTPEFWKHVGFFKAPCWSYEDERRVVFPDGSETEYSIPERAIWGVTFGCWSEMSSRLVVARAALHNNPNCYFFHASIEKSSFSLRYINTTPEYRRAINPGR